MKYFINYFSMRMQKNNFNFHCGVLVDLQFVCCCGHAKIAPQQQAAAATRVTSTPH
jgi:hypothetical protein